MSYTSQKVVRHVCTVRGFVSESRGGNNCFLTQKRVLSHAESVTSGIMFSIKPTYLFTIFKMLIDGSCCNCIRCFKEMAQNTISCCLYGVFLAFPFVHKNSKTGLSGNARQSWFEHRPLLASRERFFKNLEHLND